MLKLENKTVLKNERLKTLRSILMQPHTLYKLSPLKRRQRNILKRGMLLMRFNQVLTEEIKKKVLKTLSVHKPLLSKH